MSATRKKRVPTEKQYHLLRKMDATCILLTADKRWEPLIRWGWVEKLDKVACRITADGLRALGDAVEKYGAPVYPEDYRRANPS